MLNLSLKCFFTLFQIDRYFKRSADTKKIYEGCKVHNFSYVLHYILNMTVSLLLLLFTHTAQKKISRAWFRVKASLLLTQNAPAESYNTRRLCWVSVTSWRCQIKIHPLRIILCCIYSFPVTKLKFNDVSQTDYVEGEQEQNFCVIINR